jgi:hypothetical protein
MIKRGYVWCEQTFFLHYRTDKESTILSENNVFVRISGFGIPNTTNSVDGGVFSHLKKLIKLHQGLTLKMKVKLIDEYNKRR